MIKRLRTANLRRRTLHFVLGNLLAWVIAVYAFVPVIADDSSPIPWGSLWMFGLTLGIVNSTLELTLIPRLLRRYSVGNLFLMRLLLYVTFLLGVITMLMPVDIAGDLGITYAEALFGRQHLERMFSYRLVLGISLFTAASFSITFVRQINRMLGPGILYKLFIGKYRQPVEEDRIFMFLDLKSSTAIAEEMGAKLFNDYKNDFFYDVVEPILETQAYIYQYVGDEVIITWSTETGRDKHNALRCYFLIRDKIAQKSSQYMQKFGRVPEFRAALHGGTVVTAEIGDLKKDIVHSGDPVNVAARLEEQCKQLGRSLIVSDYLLEHATLPAAFLVENLGEISLRGKSNRIQIYSVDLLPATSKL